MNFHDVPSQGSTPGKSRQRNLALGFIRSNWHAVLIRSPGGDQRSEPLFPKYAFRVVLLKPRLAFGFRAERSLQVAVLVNPSVLCVRIARLADGFIDRLAVRLLLRCKGRNGGV